MKPLSSAGHLENAEKINKIKNFKGELKPS